MESCSMVVSSTFAIVLVLYLGLIPIMAKQNEVQIGVAGQAMILNCRGIPRGTDVTWKYNNKMVLRVLNDQVLKSKTTTNDRYETNPSNKVDLKVLDLRLSDAGIYTCEYGSHTVSTSLHVFKLTISSNGHFLPNDVPELTLAQNAPPPLPILRITLFNNGNSMVQPIPDKDTSQHKAQPTYALKLRKLETMDSGTWICHIHSDLPVINHNISFDVKVLGFQNPALERRYTTVDSTVILSWHLNFQKIKWNEGFTGQLDWKQHETATTHQLIDFNVTARRKQHETKKSSHFHFEIPENKPESTIEVKLPKIRFNHSGQYQCQLVYGRSCVQSNIELVVMKVSANPAGPLPKGAEMTLICQVSSPLSPNAHLRWARVNGTEMDVKVSKPHETKLEVNVGAAGLWSCDLIEDKVRKISLNYSVEEAPVWIGYVVIGASIGGSVLVFGLACLCIINGIKWQRRRRQAKRMAQARQHLLENKTCQCQHRLNK